MRFDKLVNQTYFVHLPFAILFVWIVQFFFIHSIPSFHLQWKFKLWAGKFAWGVKAKHCWALSRNFWKQKVCWYHPAISCLIKYLNTNNLNFHRSWRWWDQIQAIFLNLLYLKNKRHICDICGKSYNYQKSLKYHYDSVHEGIKPQPQQCVCEQCGKVFCNNQRFVQSIGEIENALWVFNCLWLYWKFLQFCSSILLLGVFFHVFIGPKCTK